jgi:hypothetical protein
MAEGPMERRDRETPRKREEGLVVQELPEEVLVYDLARHKAHCLSPLVAAIWRACDGQAAADEIARRVAAPGVASMETDVVRLALDRLAKAHLLEGNAGRPRLTGDSRRELLRKAAAIGGLSVLSLSVPTAALALSCLPAGSCVDRNCFNGPQRCCGACRQTGNVCGPGQGLTYVCQ